MKLSYTPKTWEEKKTIIHAEDMQRIEQGVQDTMNAFNALPPNAYTDIFSTDGVDDSDRLWKAVNTGGLYTGSNQTLKISDRCCTPGSDGISYVKWWIAFRDTYPEMDDNNADFVLRDCTITPENDHPILIQFLYKAGSITFENCTFRNVSFWFGREYQQKITFRNCLIEDNQYHFITTGEWNQNAEYHIENCIFRHMRPNFEEYRADVQALKLNGWAHGNIRSMGFNIKWFIRDTLFEDCMGQLNILIASSSHAPDHDPKRVELYMDGCTIRKTNGAGISFSGQPCTGWIRNCNFYNIGENRCNEEGYDLPEDKQIMWGSGTEDDPYVYACGVGANAIFSYSWTDRHEVVISNCRMYNLMENGVEGNWRELSNCHIENTGYRMNEGMWNPSQEGIYGNFAVCKGNVIRNPDKGESGIVIPKWSDGEACYYEGNIIEFDKPGEESTAAGIEIMFQAEEFDYPCYIRNNLIRGFAKKFNIYNQYSASLANLHIYDVGEMDKVLSSSDMGQRTLMGVDWLSEGSREIVRDPYFYELNEDGTPKEWKVLHGKGGVYTTGTDRYLRIQGTDYGACAVIAQDYHLNSDLYIARIKCQVRTDSGKIGFCPVSIKDNGSVAEDAYYMVLHPNIWNVDLKTEGDKTKFVEVTHSMVVSQNCRICIIDPDIDDSEDAEYRSKMDVKNVSVQLTRIQRNEAVSETETLAKPGEIYDFSNQPSSYLPANAFSVTYWIPQKDYSYGGSWTDAMWMMGKNTANDEGRGRVIVNSDTKQYGNFVCWYKSHFDLELNGHTIEFANQETYAGIAMYNGADMHIKGPGTIKAKNFAISLAMGCTCTIDKDVVIESTGTNDSGESNFALVVGGGEADNRTVLNVKGGTIGKVLSYAYTDINFDLSDADATAMIERLQTSGKIFVSKDTKVINGGTDPETEVTTVKQMTGLFTCTKLSCSHVENHTEEDLTVFGDESSVSYSYIDENGEKVEEESSLTGALGTASSTRETRKGAFDITLKSDVYTYTGIWYGDLGAVTLDLNGHSIKNDYQSYVFNLNGDCDITIMDSNDRVEGIGTIESANYAAIIANGIKLHIGRCLIRQNTGICVGGTGEWTIEDEAQLVGQIGINAGDDTKVTMNGGSITATKTGIQATPSEDSTTAVTVRGGAITSDATTIFAKDVMFDALDGKTATLTGTLNLTQNATIADGTQVLVDGAPVEEIKKATGVVTVRKAE